MLSTRVNAQQIVAQQDEVSQREMTGELEFELLSAATVTNAIMWGMTPINSVHVIGRYGARWFPKLLAR
jgi:hypothetical protein